METKLHLCCGHELLDGYVNVDSIDFGQEVVADLNKPWKFAKPGSVDYIFIKDGLEHLDSLHLSSLNAHAPSRPAEGHR